MVVFTAASLLEREIIHFRATGIQKPLLRSLRSRFVSKQRDVKGGEELESGKYHV
jgi:hypothetical protein